jgi:hypothetical protein
VACSRVSFIYVVSDRSKCLKCSAALINDGVIFFCFFLATDFKCVFYISSVKINDYSFAYEIMWLVSVHNLAPIQAAEKVTKILTHFISN